MWIRLADYLACPMCNGSLELVSNAQRRVTVDKSALSKAEELGVAEANFEKYVENGLLLCADCKVRFPIFHGLPVMLPYVTETHREFSASEPELIGRFAGYSWPDAQPAPGEQFVMRSFSKEWLEYDYDGIIWDLSYEEHEKRLLAELGVSNLRSGSRFLEIGCGLGMSTYFAQKALLGEAIGVDLSLAALSATRRFVENPFLHFVQASVFKLPLKKPLADVIYSHGVLHHTYSTREAFLSLAPFCRPGGMVYIWLYAKASTKGNPARRIAYLLEVMARPLISRNFDSILARTTMSVLAMPYLLANAWHRMRNPSVQKYNFQRALHAARDRFTPLYAHRQDFEEIATWFRDAGFDPVEQVDWRQMPAANQDNFRRNVGVRGIARGVQKAIA